jgi:glucose dehydrogenase
MAMYLPLLIDLLCLVFGLALVISGTRLLWIGGSYLKKKMRALP